METTEPKQPSTKRRMALPLFVAAMGSTLISVALLIVRQPFHAKADKAISAAKSVEQLGVIIFSPEYKLTVLLGKVAFGLQFVAVLLFLGSFFVWARNRDIRGRDRPDK